MELHHVLNLQQIAHVFVEICFYIRWIKVFRNIPPGINRRIESVEQQFIKRFFGGLLMYLGIGQR